MKPTQHNANFYQEAGGPPPNQIAPGSAQFVGMGQGMMPPGCIPNNAAMVPGYPMGYPHGNITHSHQNMSDPQMKLQAANAAAAAAVQAAQNASAGTQQQLKKSMDNSTLSSLQLDSVVGEVNQSLPGGGGSSSLGQTPGATPSGGSVGGEASSSGVGGVRSGASTPGVGGATSTNSSMVMGRNMNNNSMIAAHLSQNGIPATASSAMATQGGEESNATLNQAQRMPVSMTTTTAVTSSASSMGMMSQVQQGQGPPPLTLVTPQQRHPLQRHDSLPGAGQGPLSQVQHVSVCVRAHVCVCVCEGRKRERERERERNR